VADEVTEALRAAVAKRANRRCEYCLIDEQDTGFPHQVDHFVSRKHGGPSILENLAFACVLCNRYKGSDLASLDSQTGELSRLFDPRNDRWTDHFHLQDAIIEPVSTVGRVTIRLLRLNATERTAERQLLQELGRYPGPK
jgi:hypothetical protein